MEGDRAESYAIETRGLTRRFGKLTAVDHLDLQISVGSLFGLIGPNGAGKTTTLRMLAGLLDATSGEIVLNGQSVNHGRGSHHGRDVNRGRDWGGGAEKPCGSSC